MNSNFLLFCGALWVGYNQLQIMKTQNKIQEYSNKAQNKQFIINWLLVEIQNCKDNIKQLQEKIEEWIIVEWTPEFYNTMNVIKRNEDAIVHNLEIAKNEMNNLINLKSTYK